MRAQRQQPLLKGKFLAAVGRLRSGLSLLRGAWHVAIQHLTARKPNH